MGIITIILIRVTSNFSSNNAHEKRGGRMTRDCLTLSSHLQVNCSSGTNPILVVKVLLFTAAVMVTMGSHMTTAEKVLLLI